MLGNHVLRDIIQSITENAAILRAKWFTVTIAGWLIQKISSNARYDAL
jgi:hypothetical protein